MIEILDIQEVEKPLDITPQLAMSAARVLKAYCENHNDLKEPCKGCVFIEDDVCMKEIAFGRIPAAWKLPEE